MPDSHDNLDAFISILKKVRLRSGESEHFKERILAFTHGNFVLDDCLPSFRAAAANAQPDLFAYEKSIIYNGIAAFAKEHPQRAKVLAAQQHGKPLRMTVWHGANLFRHVQPFYIKDARS